MSQCQILKTEYQELEKLQQKFELELEKAIKSGKLEKTKELKLEIEEKLKSLKEKITPKKITAKFINPETTKTENKDKDIEIDLEKEIKSQQEFYKKFNLQFNEQEVKQILRLHKLEIQKEMATYGYDTILIVPENLPTSENLNGTLIESIPDTNSEGTYQSSNFKNGGGFQGATTSETTKTKIILTHSDQNILKDEDTNPYLKETLGKNIPMLILNISKAEWKNMDNAMKKNKEQEAFQKLQQGAGINLEVEINGNKKKIQSEGLSLNEYLIFQRQYFEKNQNHLDEKGYSWLTKSCSASRVVRASWHPDDRQLSVLADVLGNSIGSLGCRLSRSFELT